MSPYCHCCCCFVSRSCCWYCNFIIIVIAAFVAIIITMQTISAVVMWRACILVNFAVMAGDILVIVRAGCTMGGPPAVRGPPISCQIFNTLFWRLNVWTFSVGLNVTTTTKKGSSTFLGKKCTTRENPGYAYEKRAPALRRYASPRMVNPVLVIVVLVWHQRLDDDDDDADVATTTTAAAEPIIIIIITCRPA